MGDSGLAPGSRGAGEGASTSGQHDRSERESQTWHNHPHLYLAGHGLPDGSYRGAGVRQTDRGIGVRVADRVGPSHRRAWSLRRFLDGSSHLHLRRRGVHRAHQAGHPHSGGAVAPSRAAGQGDRHPRLHLGRAVLLRRRARLEQAGVRRHGYRHPGERAAHRRDPRRGQALVDREERVLQGRVLPVRRRHHRPHAAEISPRSGSPEARAFPTSCRRTSPTW